MNRYELKLPYLKGCRLILENELKGFADDWKLFLWKNKKIYKVNKMSDLSGNVLLEKPNHALSFLRIFSNPLRLLNLSKEMPSFIEILNRDKLNYDPGFGSRYDYDTIRKYFSQKSNLFGEKYMKYPLIIKNDGNFVISRLVISHRSEVYELREILTEDGVIKNSNRVKILKPYKDGLRVIVPFPIRE